MKLNEIFMSGRHIIACGFAYGGHPVCSDVKKVHRCNFQMCGDGFLYPGMSGGPVIDATTNVVIGVNTAVDGADLVLSPIVEIFQNLGVKEQ